MRVRVFLSTMTMLSTKKRSRVFSNSTKPLIRAMINSDWRLTQKKKGFLQLHHFIKGLNNWRMSISTKNAPEYNAIQLWFQKINLQNYYLWVVELGVKFTSKVNVDALTDALPLLRFYTSFDAKYLKFFCKNAFKYIWFWLQINTMLLLWYLWCYGYQETVVNIYLWNCQ